MKAPCFETDATKKDPYYDPAAEKAFWDGNKLRISPTVAKSFYREAKAHYDRGLDFQETLDAIHHRSGLKHDTIAKILAADKTVKRMTTEMWHKQAKYRSIKTSAQLMVDNTNVNKWWNRAGYAWDSARALATLYHGGVIPFTHARNLAFQKAAIRNVWLGMVKDAYRYGPAPFRTGGKGEAAWAQDWEDLMATDKWKEAVRYGVEAMPGDKPVGMFANLAKGWGVRSFDAIKKGRVELFHIRKNELKMFDDASLRALANEVNISTGGLKMKQQTARILAIGSFAPKVWITRRLEAFQPIRYALNARGMTPEMRKVYNQSLKMWGRHAAVAIGILEGNDLYNKYFTNGKQRVNFFDFQNPGTLWRMNWGGHIIPISPLVEVIRAPVAAGAVLFYHRRELHGESAFPGASGEILFREVANALHPQLINAIELITGREVFGVPRHQRRLPFPGATQLVRGEDPQERDPRMSWAEYVGGKGPIPVADFVKEVFSPALTEEGIEKSQAEKYVTGLLAGAFSGFMGTHSFEKSPQSGPQRTRHKKTPGTLGGTKGIGTLR